MTLSSTPGPAKNRRLLHRGNVRDTVLVLALVSAAGFPLPFGNFWCAFGILAAGSLLNFMTKGILIRNTVLCDRGVYRICRHPYYLSNFLIDLSFCLLSGNVYLILAYPFLFFWAYGPTFLIEETQLCEWYPDRYREYRRQTPQVLPDPRSRICFREVFDEFSFRRITSTELVRLTRFWAMAMILPLIHQGRAMGWAELRANPGKQDVLGWVIPAGVLLLAGTVIQGVGFLWKRGS